MEPGLTAADVDKGFRDTGFDPAPTVTAAIEPMRRSSTTTLLREERLLSFMMWMT
jgi:hypothetical protein